MEASYSNKPLLIILLFTSSVSLISAFQKTNNEFIRTSCGFTSYPSLCINSLLDRASAIQTSPKLLVQTALSVTLDTTCTTYLSMVKLSQVYGLTPREVVAMSCKDAGLVRNDIQTLVSAALTDKDTCSERCVNDRVPDARPLSFGSAPSPSLDRKETADGLFLRLDMPGLSKDNVKVTVEQNTLVIKGEGPKESEDKDGGRTYTEQYTLTEKMYKTNDIIAEMTNGVLKVTVPKVKDEERTDVIHVLIN